MKETKVQEILLLNQHLLDSIAQGDWATYEGLCDPSLTAFEPEALGQLVQGMDFHRFYFANGGFPGRPNTTMASPHVRFMGEVAVVSYVRLLQRMGDTGPETLGFEETRVWQQQNGKWKHVHFHRSKIPLSCHRS